MNLDVFTYAGQQIRTVSIDGEPWFVAADVCAVLGIGNPSQAVTYLDDDERTTTLITSEGGQQRPANVINEPGLYSLILRSRKPEAKEFKRWIIHDVLPTIRKTGTYGSGSIDMIASLPAGELLALVGKVTERLALSEAKVAELASPAAAWTSLVSTDGDYTITHAAKVLGRDGKCPGPRQLHDWLEARGWIYRQGGTWTVKQATENAGHMVMRLSAGYIDQKTGEHKPGKPQCRVTHKGLEKLRDLLAAERELVTT